MRGPLAKLAVAMTPNPRAPANSVAGSSRFFIFILTPPMEMEILAD